MGFISLDPLLPWKKYILHQEEKKEGYALPLSYEVG